MASTNETPEYMKPALYVGTIILSFIAAILIFVAEFGWWWPGEYSWGYDFALYGEFVAWYGKLSLVILGLGFLVVALIAVQKLYPVLTLNEDTEKMIEKIAFITSIGLLVLTIIIAIVFAVMVSDSRDWDYGTGFYAGIVGSLLSALFLWLAQRIKTT